MPQLDMLIIDIFFFINLGVLLFVFFVFLRTIFYNFVANDKIFTKLTLFYLLKLKYFYYISSKL